MIWRLPLLLVCCAVLSGCTPSGFVARQLIRAPNTFPQVVSPEPRLYFTFPEPVLETFPLQRATVGAPELTLAYRILPPADYRTRLTLTNHSGSTGPVPLYLFTSDIPGSPTPFTAQPRGTVVLLHGYGLSQDSMIPWALLLAEAGWRCVLVDLRGHGNSNGDRIHFGLRESADLTALIDELQRREQASWPVSVMGVSYGAAVALRWEMEEPRVRCCIAVSPYGRLGDAIEGLRAGYASWLPAGIIRRASEKMPSLVGAGPGGLDPMEWMQSHPVGALFVAAGEDEVATPDAIRALEARAATPAQVIEVPGASHEILPFRIDELRESVTDWLRDHGSAPPP